MAGIDIDKLGQAIAEDLEEYTQEITEDVKAIVSDVSKKCVRQIRANSPRSEDGGHEYANGWRAKKIEKTYNVRFIIHNSKRPGLVHLLENGHAKVNGGFVPGRPHVAPAEKAAERELERRIPEAIKNDS